MPYRAVVFKELNQDQVLVYCVAGASDAAMRADNALKKAFTIHGGHCFYCDERIEALTLDHVQPVTLGGSELLSNLVIACRRCNDLKGAKPLKQFMPDKARKWLQAQIAQKYDRLHRL